MQVAHISEYIRAEMEVRGWSEEVLAAAMGFSSTKEYQINLLALQMLLNVQDPDMYIGELAQGLGRAIDVDPQFLMNLDDAWRKEAAKCKS